MSRSGSLPHLASETDFPGGVYFNIGRIRTATEPRKAAWSRYGSGAVGEFQTSVDGQRSSYHGECSRDSGCGVVFRQAKDEGIGFAQDNRGRQRLDPAQLLEHESFEGIGLENDVDGNDDYVYESPDEDALEYDSDAAAEGEMELDDSIDAVADQMDVDEDEASQPEDSSYRQFWYDALAKDEEGQKKLGSESDRGNMQSWYNGRQGWVAHYPEPKDPGDTVFPLFYPHPDGDDASEHGSDGSFVAEESNSDDGRRRMRRNAAQIEKDQRRLHRDYGKLWYHAEDREQVEHIAGPGCVDREGYNGNEISAEEMQGCLTLQCLVRKPPPGSMIQYSPESDDEDFEREGDFFLSGLSDRMPSRDDNIPTVYPPRHECEMPHAENCMWDEDRADEFAMPFHPACFEIYKRASKLRSPPGTKKPDVEGLTSWWTLEADYATFHSGESHYQNKDVEACAEQDWDHKAGTEWLAANPLFVPSLSDIFASVIETDPSFDPHDGAFTLVSPPNTTSLSTTDPFALLPHEVLLIILSHLPSPSIASLRLSSRTYTQLPISFFRFLLNRDMPWLWEAHPPTLSTPTPYSLWSSTTAAQLKTHSSTLDRQLRDTAGYITIIRAEMPELLDELIPARIQLDEQLTLEDQRDHHGPLSRSPLHLPQHRTNWFKLHTLLSRSLRTNHLKGLRNRSRIWQCCTNILSRIENYRHQAANGKLEYEFPVRDVRAAVRRNHEAERARREAWEAGAQQRREEAEAEAQRWREEEARKKKEEEEEVGGAEGGASEGGESNVEGGVALGGRKATGGAAPRKATGGLIPGR